MTRNEAISTLQDAINKINSYIKLVEDLPGSMRNQDCYSFLTRASATKEDCTYRMNRYKNMDDAAFSRLNEGFFFKNLATDLALFERTSKFFKDKSKRTPLSSPSGRRKLPKSSQAKVSATHEADQPQPGDC